MYSKLEEGIVSNYMDMMYPQPEVETQQPSIDGVQLAMGGNAAGRNSDRPMSDIPQALFDVGAGFAREGVAQAAGVFGDIESIGRGLRSVFNRPEDEGRINAFLKGMQEKTLLPTTEQISKEGYTVPGTDMTVGPLPPAIPPGVADEEMRKKSAEYGGAFGSIAPLPSALDAGIKGVKTIAKKAEGMFKKVSPKDIPSLFSHGTSEAGADAIMQSGKFDPSAGERKYSYSQFGRQAAYLTPEKGWWLDAERAASGRAVTYEAAVDAKIDPKANIVRIDSPEELHQLAKKAGFADAYDMMKSLDVESIEYAKDAEKAKTSSLQEFTAYIKESNADFPDNPDYIKEHYEDMKNLSSYFDEADNATKQLIDSGIDGIYISDEFSANLSPETYKNWYPAGDQLAMFRPELVKPLAKKLLKKESTEAK